MFITYKPFGQEKK